MTKFRVEEVSERWRTVEVTTDAGRRVIIDITQRNERVRVSVLEVGYPLRVEKVEAESHGGTLQFAIEEATE